MVGKQVAGGCVGALCDTASMSDGLDPVHVVEQWQARAWGECDMTAVDDLIVDPVLRHGPSGTQRRSHDEMKHDLGRYQQALGMTQITVHDRVADGDRVWSRITMHGANIRTGEPRTVQWLQIHRVVDGRIAEYWVLYATDVNW
jgi:ketosteroid isomerase-like protein